MSLLYLFNSYIISFTWPFCINWLSTMLIRSGEYGYVNSFWFAKRKLFVLLTLSRIRSFQSKRFSVFLFHFPCLLWVDEGFYLVFVFIRSTDCKIIFLYYYISGWIAEIVTNLVVLYCSWCVAGFDIFCIGVLHSWL